MPISPYNKFQVFPEDVLSGKHDFTMHTFKVLLTNVAPMDTDEVIADLTEISAGNGYTAGGTATTITVNRAGAVTSVEGTDVMFTATADSIGPFRYAVLYNNSVTGKPLISWWDYGNQVTLLNTEQFAVALSFSGSIFQMS